MSKLTTDSRRDFVDILALDGFDLKTEFVRAYYNLFGESFPPEVDTYSYMGIDVDDDETHSFYEFIEANFEIIEFRGTAISLQDFNDEHGISFPVKLEEITMDGLLDLLEYTYNFALAIDSHPWTMSILNSLKATKKYCLSAADKICHKWVPKTKNGFTGQILVPANKDVERAAEVAPESVAYDLLGYDHRSLKGNLKAKRQILYSIFNDLEPNEALLKKLAPRPMNKLYDYANNYDLRHNNSTPEDKKFTPELAEISESELEEIYDTCRDLCAAAYLLLHNKEHYTGENA